MPISHRDLWNKIRHETKGVRPQEEIRILESYLADWPEFKGPYQEMKKKFEKRIEELKTKEKVLGSGTAHHDPFSVRKRGLAEVALVGLPNSGKSTLLRALTGAEPEIADYPYTTLTPNIAMLNMGGFAFEIVDLPPVPDGPLDTVPYAAGLKEAVLNADLLGLVVDLRGDAEAQLDALGEALGEIGVRAVMSAADLGSSRGERPAAEERSGHGAAGGRSLSPRGAIVFGTRGDAAAPSDVAALANAVPGAALFTNPLPESSVPGVGEALCRLLGRIVVLARDPDDPDDPLAYAVADGATVLDLAQEIHGELAARARRGKVWGASASFPGQEVGLDHHLEPGDIVEIVTR